MISEHARRSQDPLQLSVSRAIERALAMDRVGAFEDTTKLPSGGDWHGAVMLGRLYLHASILNGRDSLEGPYCPYPLEMLYHEGVHLTQPCLSLIFAPDSSEDEAQAEARRFSEAWSKEFRDRH